MEVVEMNIATELKKFFVEIGTNSNQVSEKIGMTTSNLTKKIRTNTLYSKDIENIADTLGYDIKIEFRKRE